MPASNRTTLIWGILLVVAGLVFLLNNFNVVPGRLLDWWPVLLIGAGLWLVAQTLTRRRESGLVGGIMLGALGSYWLARNFGWVDEGLFLPVLLIALGAGMLLRTLLPGRQ